MNLDQLKAKFPNSSEAFLKANSAFLGTQPHLSVQLDKTPLGPKKQARRTTSNEHPSNCSPLPHPKSEQNKTAALGGTAQREAESLPRTIVRFTGYRVRPLDPDNFAGSVKDLLDGLRHAQLISGDEPWKIKLETEQVRVAKFSDERTEIEVQILP